ncbi:TetR/AcrR family transcriptional regulator [Promicromonospora sp. NPDC060271]|uniref:TetR/AcrR family transcriptional regulator n=1 Tax=Promicromonospora sp. NPDC060271 TaxID=3347089 RepID=UPI0036578E4A
MSPVSLTSSGRGRGRPRVPLERIAHAALELVDEGGPQALTMRALAARLNSGVAVLYRAVPGRSDLIAVVIDQVLGDADFSALGDGDASEPAGWEAVCRATAVTLFETLAAHPGVASLLVEHVPTGPNALALRERVLSLLLANGFSASDAARTYATLARLVIGFAAQLQAESETDHEQIRSVFSDLDAATFPATVAAADVLPYQQLVDEFRTALDWLIAGLSVERGRAVA